jgi:hypothetical protein
VQAVVIHVIEKQLLRHLPFESLEDRGLNVRIRRVKLKGDIQNIGRALGCHHIRGPEPPPHAAAVSLHCTNGNCAQKRAVRIRSPATPACYFDTVFTSNVKALSNGVGEKLFIGLGLECFGIVARHLNGSNN